MAEGEFETLTGRISTLERTIERLTAQVGANQSGQTEAVTHAEYDRLNQENRQYTERLEQEVRGLQATVTQLMSAIQSDATLATAFTQAGMQVSNTAITSLAATKLTGDVAAAQMQTNIVTALSNNGGDIATANLDGNVIAAINASAGGGDYGKFSTGNISTSGTAAVGNTTITGTAQISSTLTAQGEANVQGALNHDGSTVGFYGVTPTTRQTVAQLTNNVTSGGTSNTMEDFDPSVFLSPTEAGKLRNTVYQMGEKIKQLETAVRTLGLTQN